MPRAEPRPYEIDSLAGSSFPKNAANLRDIDSKAPYPFNPVSLTRLIPYSLEAIAEPIEGEPHRIEIFRPGNAHLVGRVSGQSATGCITVDLDDGKRAVVDLSKEEYRWL